MTSETVTSPIIITSPGSTRIFRNDELDKMIESCLKLLKTKVKTSNFLSKFNKLLKKLFSCKCKCKC